MIWTLTGASGFIGGYLVQRLKEQGHQVRVLSRKPGNGEGCFAWDPLFQEPPEASLRGADVVVHLAGESISQRWTREAKDRIRQSRVMGTRHLVHALSTLSARPRVLISASAVGYYGSRGDEVLNESSGRGEGFLPGICAEWEQEAKLAESLGMRVVRLRIGVVLHRQGGALKKLLPIFKAGIAGPIGGGQQWMSWIHREDLIRQVIWAGTHEHISGAVNGVSVEPTTNQSFTAALARAVHRPAFLPVPAFGLKLLYGEMAEVMLGSQRVLPAAATAHGFDFEYPKLDDALRAALA